jgi:hypothetical protein
MHFSHLISRNSGWKSDRDSFRLKEFEVSSLSISRDKRVRLHAIELVPEWDALSKELRTASYHMSNI